MLLLARCMRSAARLTKEHWDKTQVELQGTFSLDYVKLFEEHVARTSTWKALLICLWTPVPVVCMALVVEAIPMEDPSTHTARQSPFVWLRTVTMSLIASVCYLEQFRQHLPSLRLPRSQLLLVSIISTAVSGGFQFCLADKIAYPFPFSIVLASFVWAPTLSALFIFAIRKQLREEPQLVNDLRRHLAVCICQFFLVGVYPLFNAGFKRVSAWYQTALVFVLPIIKLGAKNWISRWIANTEEARAESSDQQGRATHRETVDASRKSLADCIAERAIPLAQRMQTDSDWSAALAGGDTTSKMPEVNEVRTDTRSATGFKTLSRVFNREERVLLTEETQKLLFISEFVALIEYTEVVMPFVFNMYVLVMFYFPNRDYHGFFDDLTAEKLYNNIANVTLYASLELTSLIVMAAILWYRLRLSMLHQIAFVLENRQVSVQVKVLMWSLFVMQTDTQQSGIDYTFKFAWLKG